MKISRLVNLEVSKRLLLRGFERLKTHEPTKSCLDLESRAPNMTYSCSGAGNGAFGRSTLCTLTQFQYHLNAFNDARSEANLLPTPKITVNQHNPSRLLQPPFHQIPHPLKNSLALPQNRREAIHRFQQTLIVNPKFQLLHLAIPSHRLSQRSLFRGLRPRMETSRPGPEREAETGALGTR
jgi:hypothetical protein